MKEINSSQWSIRKGIFRIILSFFLVWSGIQAGFISGTNSLFSDRVIVQKNEFSAVYWIPELEVVVSPESPDGKSGLYKTTPCVLLAYSGLSSGTATIWYEFSNDGDPVFGGIVYPGSCVPIPDGDPTYFQAVAVNDANSEWKSEIVSRTFNVDTENCSDEKNIKCLCVDEEDENSDHGSKKHKESSCKKEDHDNKDPELDKDKEKKQKNNGQSDMKLDLEQDNGSKIPCLADSVKSKDAPEPMEGETKVINNDESLQSVEEDLTGGVMAAEQEEEDIDENVQILDGASSEVVK